MKNFLLTISLMILLASCNLGKDDSIVETKTPIIVKVLKSYEPKAYKGKVPESFYSYYGFRDFWRYPLIYPYAVCCIDLKTTAFLANDKDVKDFDASGSITPLLSGFNRFIFDEHFFIGEFNTGKKTSYEVFSFSENKQLKLNENEGLKMLLKRIGFRGDTSFVSISQYEEKF